MSKYKYGIVIPSHNGYEGLKLTIPYMLEINRKDFEIVVSINGSTDKSKDFLKSISDERLKVYVHTKKIPHSTNLNFAYSKSTADWVGHLGDDDVILKKRFDYLDKFSDKYDIILGKCATYVWENVLPHQGEPNTTDNKSLIYEFITKEKKGKDFYKEYLNNFGVPAGGQWLVKRSIYSEVVKHYGYFSPDAANVEFFSFRASAKFSENIIEVDYPLMIAGRMAKSSSAVIENPNAKIWDYNFENPGWFDCAKVNCSNYQTISFDGALRVIKKFPQDKKLLNKNYWAKSFVGHFLFWHPGSNKFNQKCSKIVYLLWIIRNFHIYAFYECLIAIKKKIFKIFFKKKETYPFQNQTVFLKNIGIQKITQFADYLEKNLENKKKY